LIIRSGSNNSHDQHEEYSENEGDITATEPLESQNRGMILGVETIGKKTYFKSSKDSDLKKGLGANEAEGIELADMKKLETLK
jgi:hypothetical protein